MSHQGRRALVAALIFLVALAAPNGAMATFTGANGRITFARFVPETSGLEIFSATSAGGDITQLTVSGQDHSSIFSDWSPDGTRIAFDSDRPSDGDVQVYVMAWNGGLATQLTHGPGFHGDPAWSPDGSRLALEADWGNYPALEGIWTIPATGASGPNDPGVVRVTSLPAGILFESEPQYSPDGRSITFSAFRDCHSPGRAHVGVSGGCTSAIFVVGTDGTGLRQITPWGLNSSSPDWSPDGSKLTFDSCDFGRIGCRGNVYVANADGSRLTRLTNSPPVANAGQGFANFRFDLINNPVWSPDGARILYTHWIPGTNATELVSIRPDGSDPTTIVGGDFFQNKADWGTHP